MLHNIFDTKARPLNPFVPKRDALAVEVADREREHQRDIDELCIADVALRRLNKPPIIFGGDGHYLQQPDGTLVTPDEVRSAVRRRAEAEARYLASSDRLREARGKFYR